MGVDIFFVISGFLITSLIFKELEAGTFSLANFWGRRARRIVPASLTLTLAVLVAGWFLLLPADYKGVGNAAVAQGVFASNVYFWATSDYFGAHSNLLPFLHTWSLAVEEQFYLFFPFLLLACDRPESARRRSLLLAVLATCFGLSLALSVYSLPKWPITTFYLLPDRAWELFIGSFLAVSPRSWTPARRLQREALSALGCLAILGAIFCYDARTPFPGAAALLPCLGAVLIIWSNGPAPTAAPNDPKLTLVGRVLASPVPVFIGLISYSLYLWHWPLLAFSSYCLRVPLTPAYRVMIVLLSIGLGTLSWRFVEGPFRKRLIFPSRRSILVFAGSGLACTLMLGLAINRLKGVPRRVPPRVDELAGASADRVPFKQCEIQDVLSDHLTSFGATFLAAKPALFLWGDSHGGAVLPAIDLYCRRQGIAGRAALHSNTTPLLDYYTRAEFGLNEKAIPFARATFDYIQRNRIPRVFLAANWAREFDNSEKFEHAIARTVEAFGATDTQLFVLLQVPTQRVDVPRALALDAWWPHWHVDWRGTVQAHRSQQALLYRMAARYGSSRCIFVDPAPALADPGGRYYEATRDGRPLYSDEGHLSAFGATTVIEPLLERVLGAP